MSCGMNIHAVNNVSQTLLFIYFQQITTKSSYMNNINSLDYLRVFIVILLFAKFWIDYNFCFVKVVLIVLTTRGKPETIYTGYNFDRRRDKLRTHLVLNC